jgi:hypothetical protein
MIKKGKIHFKRTDRYFSEIATDVAISGPTPDELYHVTFISDKVEVNSQTSTPVAGDGGVFELNYTSDDNEFSRVALGLCSMTPKAYFGLFSAIIERAKTQGCLDKLIEILASRGILDDIKLKASEDDKE